MDSFQFAPRNFEIARVLGTAGEYNRIELLPQALDWDVLAYFRTGNKFHALCGHLLQAPINDVLLHFEFGDAIAKQTANAVRFLVNDYRVSRAAQLLRGGQSSGTRANDGDFLSGAKLGWLGANPAFLKSAIHYVFFNLLDRDWGLIDPQNAGGLARGWTNSSSEFRKIIRCVQLADRFFPASVIHQIVPVGDQIVDGTSSLAERNAAVHAARTLRAKFFFGKIEIDLKPIIDALRYGTSQGKLAREFQKSRVLTHVASRPQPEPWATESEYRAEVCGSVQERACVHGEIL